VKRLLAWLLGPLGEEGMHIIVCIAIIFIVLLYAVAQAVLKGA
jgi:uncharacterized protein YhhL (DUF1145 family)